MQCREKKKVGKHKTTVGNELIADWHLWVDRISVQNGQKRDWTRSTIFCFWEAQLAFYKYPLQTGLSQAHISKMREVALSCSRHLPQEQEQSHLWHSMGTVTSCCPLPVFPSVHRSLRSSHHFRALRWHCLGLPDSTKYRWPKPWEKKPSSSLNAIKISSTLSLQAVHFLQPTHY